jgi:serine/threonine protein kinase
MYAFACTAFEVLTAQLLFDAGDEMSLMSLHVSHDGWPQKLAALAHSPALADLSVILAACLRRDPRDRPTAAATRKAFAKARAKLRSFAWPVSVPAAAVAG